MFVFLGWVLFHTICLAADASYGNVTKAGTLFPDPLSTLCRPKGKRQSKHLDQEAAFAASQPFPPALHVCKTLVNKQLCPLASFHGSQENSELIINKRGGIFGQFPMQPEVLRTSHVFERRDFERVKGVPGVSPEPGFWAPIPCVCSSARRNPPHLPNKNKFPWSSS